MDTVISFTPAQLWATIVSICGGFSAIVAAVLLILKGITKMRSPNTEQNKRISVLETRIARHDEMLDNDNQRLKSIETANRVVLKGMQALLRHGINGNDIKALRDAEQDVNKYLIDR